MKVDQFQHHQPRRDYVSSPPCWTVRLAARHLWIVRDTMEVDEIEKDDPIARNETQRRRSIRTCTVAAMLKSLNVVHGERG